MVLKSEKCVDVDYGWSLRQLPTFLNTTGRTVRVKYCEVPYAMVSIKGMVHFAEETITKGVTVWWVIAHPVFGKIEDTARQRCRSALLLAHPVLGSHLRP